MPKSLSTGEQIPVVGITQLPNVAYSDDAAARANLYAGALNSLAKGLAQIGDVANERMVAETVQKAELSGYKAGAEPGFQPIRKPGVIFEAYNKAGLATYEAKLRADAKGSISAIALKHYNDPTSMAAALTKYREGVEGTLPVELKQRYRLEFESTATPFVHSAHTKALELSIKGAEDAAKADLAGSSDLARALGGISASGDPVARAQTEAALGTSLGGLVRNQIANIQSGFTSPGAAQLFLTTATQQMARDYLEGYVIGAPDKNRALADIASGKLRTMMPTITTDAAGNLVPQFVETSVLEAVPLKDRAALMSALHADVDLDYQRRQRGREEQRFNAELQLRADLRAVATTGDPAAARAVEQNPWATGQDVLFARKTRAEGPGRTDPAVYDSLKRSIVLGQGVTDRDILDAGGSLSRDDQAALLRELDQRENAGHWSQSVPFKSAVQVASDNLIGFTAGMFVTGSDQQQHQRLAVGRFVQDIRTQTQTMFDQGYQIGHLPAGKVIEERPDGVKIFSPENWTQKRIDELGGRIKSMDTERAKLKADLADAQRRASEAQRKAREGGAGRAAAKADYDAAIAEAEDINRRLRSGRKTMIDVLTGNDDE